MKWFKKSKKAKKVDKKNKEVAVEEGKKSEEIKEEESHSPQNSRLTMLDCPIETNVGMDIFPMIDPPYEHQEDDEVISVEERKEKLKKQISVLDRALEEQGKEVNVTLPDEVLNSIEIQDPNKKYSASQRLSIRQDISAVSNETNLASEAIIAQFNKLSCFKKSPVKFDKETKKKLARQLTSLLTYERSELQAELDDLNKENK